MSNRYCFIVSRPESGVKPRHRHLADTRQTTITALCGERYGSTPRDGDAPQYAKLPTCQRCASKAGTGTIARTKREPAPVPDGQTALF